MKNAYSTYLSAFSTKVENADTTVNTQEMRLKRFVSVSVARKYICRRFMSLCAFFTSVCFLHLSVDIIESTAYCLVTFRFMVIESSESDDYYYSCLTERAKYMYH